MSLLRIGHGYDLHRLEPVAPHGPGRPFVLAGLPFEFDRGPVGHSDGDAVFHAVTDALLAAVGLPDIGQLFPDDDPRWEGADSERFLIAARDRLREGQWRVENIDVTVICERPKLGPRKTEMIANLARVLGVRCDQINLKGKTHEMVDAVGEGRAIEVHVVALVEAETVPRGRDYPAMVQALRSLDLVGRGREERMQAVVDVLWEGLATKGVSWLGFYIDEPDKTEDRRLILGPRQPKPACSPIGLHGVCGQALVTRSVRLVRDVLELGPNYIACDPSDRSELVVPLIDASGRCWAVLDLDSHQLGAFDRGDVEGVCSALAAARL